MVSGPRRDKRDYPLLLRKYGRSCLDLDDLDDIRLAIPQLLLLIQNMNWANPNYQILLVVITILVRYHELVGVITVSNEVFARTNLTAADFTDTELYDMRMPSRVTFYRIFYKLNFPDIIRCDNNTTCCAEEAFLMLLYRLSFPTKLFKMQKLFGREYSQVSRIIRATFKYIDDTHKHLVSNNSIRLFAHRFALYNQKFKVKYQSLHGVVTPPHWNNVAMFSDGTKLKTTRNVRQNFSGHKKVYCLSTIDTTGVDGVIYETSKFRAGRYNDHMQQDLENLGPRIIACQVPNGTRYVTGTDKGLHRTPGVRAMHNHVHNTPLETFENRCFSSCRVTNEHDIGRVEYQWKYLEFQKGLMLNSMPLGVYRRVTVILTNALTCCERNATSSLDEYFAL